SEGARSCSAARSLGALVMVLFACHLWSRKVSSGTLAYAGIFCQNGPRRNCLWTREFSSTGGFSERETTWSWGRFSVDMGRAFWRPLWVAWAMWQAASHLALTARKRCGWRKVGANRARVRHGVLTMTRRITIRINCHARDQNLIRGVD